MNNKIRFTDDELKRLKEDSEKMDYISRNQFAMKALLARLEAAEIIAKDGCNVMYHLNEDKNCSKCHSYQVWRKKAGKDK